MKSDGKLIRHECQGKRTGIFIDVFAGCGGLSLGLLNAGWTGLFAVEKNVDAFNTLAENLVNNENCSFTWPDWLPKKALSVTMLLRQYRNQLEALKGKVDLLAGAPPCQGFSLAGRRIYSDPRNSLFEQYVELVKILRPRLLLVENVQGFNLPFRKNGKRGFPHESYAKTLEKRLRRLHYKVFSELIDLSDYGVPQTRKRFIIVALKRDSHSGSTTRASNPFDVLRAYRQRFLRSKQLSTQRPVSAKQAIGDLEIDGKDLMASPGERIAAFKQLDYSNRRKYSQFIKLMRKDSDGAPDSIRLPRHRSTTVRQFKKILATCSRGRALGDSDRKRLGMNKQVLTPLHPNLPASTVTTLPDDIIHYSEPRILTVRENARLQTFPDWFKFTGDYTTGGKNRRRACPRYTQVGNAVPPLFTEAIGRVLSKFTL